ncbi:WD40 repeat domain-containing protein [Nonomuraea sp. NPDC052265]|uniref:WD40 repeat domain-containing protein n=1 Tax=Nonomuraea sp. NPDC052265 TaxID=3364374 RepID=UPI0037CC3D8D
MKILCAALAVLSVVVAVPGAARAAVPAGATSAPIRYAAASDCDKGRLDAAWCGPWWYRTTDGRRHPLKEAGRWEDAVAVSGDGRRLAYIRAKDARLVVRDLDGRTRVSRVRAWPSKSELELTRVTMSYDGSLVAVDCCWAGFTDHPARVYDAATGALLTKVTGVSVHDDALSFSSDGDQILVRTYDGRSGRLSVHDLNGRRTGSVVPPRLIGVNAATAALNADGRTVAVYVSGRRPGIALYDLKTRQVTARFPVPASGQKVERDPAEDRVTEVDTDVRLDWTGDSTLRMVRKVGFKLVRVQVYGIDAGTEAVVFERSYAIAGTTSEALSGL